MNVNIPNPDFTTVLQQLRNQVMSELNCHLFGTIVSFDTAKQTVRVRLNFQRAVFNQEPNGLQQLQNTPTIIDYPVLLDCPAMILSGGGGVITMPIKAGDTCLVLFHDRDFDLWFETGNV